MTSLPSLSLTADEDMAYYQSMSNQSRDFTSVEDLTGATSPKAIARTIEAGTGGFRSDDDGEETDTERQSRVLKKTSDPRACRLCNYKEERDDDVHADDTSSGAFAVVAAAPAASICTRCGLLSSLAVDQNAVFLAEAARAYRFKLVAQMSGLIDDLADLVVSYLLWYRAPDDFRVGSVVDAQDFRGQWYEAVVVDTKEDQVLVKFKGFSSKWNTWIHRLSASLAPSKTCTGKDPASSGGCVRGGAGGGLRVIEALPASPRSSSTAAAIAASSGGTGDGGSGGHSSRSSSSISGTNSGSSSTAASDGDESA